MLTIPEEDEPEENYHFPINYGISGWEPKHMLDALNSLTMMTDSDDPFNHTYSDASTWSILTDHLSYTRHPEAKTGSLKFFGNFNRQNQRYVQSSSVQDYTPTDITATAPDIYFEKFDEVKVNLCEVTQFNEAVDISTTYLGRDIKDPLVMKAPFSFQYSLLLLPSVI